MASIEITKEELNHINEIIADIPDNAWQLYSKNISKYEQELEAKYVFKNSDEKIICYSIIIGRENYSNRKNNWKYRLFYFSSYDNGVSFTFGKNTIKDRFFFW